MVASDVRVVKINRIGEVLLREAAVDVWVDAREATGRVNGNGRRTAGGGVWGKRGEGGHFRGES